MLSVNRIECNVQGVLVVFSRISTYRVEAIVADDHGDINPTHGAPFDITNADDVGGVVTAVLDSIGMPDCHVYHEYQRMLMQLIDQTFNTLKV